MSLHPDHLADLRGSGLSDELTEKAGFYSVTPMDNSFGHVENEVQALRRKIKLKTQAVLLILGERQELRERLCLLRMRERLLGEMGHEFDRRLSSKVDCIDFLLRDEGHLKNE
jgi:hypothetical protein